MVERTQRRDNFIRLLQREAPAVMAPLTFEIPKDDVRGRGKNRHIVYSPNRVAFYSKSLVDLLVFERYVSQYPGVRIEHVSDTTFVLVF